MGAGGGGRRVGAGGGGRRVGAVSGSAVIAHLADSPIFAHSRPSGTITILYYRLMLKHCMETITSQQGDRGFVRSRPPPRT